MGSSELRPSAQPCLTAQQLALLLSHEHFLLL
jgi:hypothetical protein